MNTTNDELTPEEIVFREELPPYTRRLSAIHCDYLRKLMKDPGMIAIHESDLEMQAMGSE